MAVARSDFNISDTKTVSRAAKADLYAVGVPEVKNSEGGAADRESTQIGAPVDLSIEENDKLNQNEITMQLIGIRPAAGWTSKRLYFVVQFFDFGSAVTQTVAVAPLSGDADEFGAET